MPWTSWGYDRASLGFCRFRGLSQIARYSHHHAGPRTRAEHTFRGVEPIMSAKGGDVIVIDNAGHLDENCWGEIMTYASNHRGIRGVTIDGVSRNVDVIKMLKFPVYARGRVPLTARGRTMKDTYNCLIRFAGVQVRPGNIILGDDNGVAVIPQEQVEEILAATAEILQRELAIVEKLKQGTPLHEVGRLRSATTTRC